MWLILPFSEWHNFTDPLQVTVPQNIRLDSVVWEYVRRDGLPNLSSKRLKKEN